MCLCPGICHSIPSLVVDIPRGAAGIPNRLLQRLLNVLDVLIFGFLLHFNRRSLSSENWFQHAQGIVHGTTKISMRKSFP